MAEDSELLVMTSDIIQHYLQANQLAADDLPTLIQTVHKTLKTLDAVAAIEEPDARVSTAQVKKSIMPHGLISFIDRKTYKSLKRHLTTNGMTPDTYRAKFGLPRDYPMVSPDYSAARSALAKSVGLGQQGRSAKGVRKAKPKAK